MQTRLSAFQPRVGHSDSATKGQIGLTTRQYCRQFRASRRNNLLLRAASDESSGDESKASDWKLPLAGSDTNWREFRARLVAGESKADAAANPETADEPTTSGRQEGNMWAHPIAQPEKGCLLLAHPLMFNSQQMYFHQAVILITSHDESGTAGLILNKPMEHLIGQLAGAESLMPEFDENRLFLGGDVDIPTAPNIMQLLHDRAHLKGCIEVVPGVYLGGFQAAKKAVRTGDIPSSRFRWYCRYAGWAPGQLQAECDKGVWFTAAASADLILHPCCLVNGRQHWHTVLQRMGGEYDQLSEALLVDKQSYEDVWGKSEYLPSTQNKPRRGDGKEGN